MQSCWRVLRMSLRECLRYEARPGYSSGSNRRANQECAARFIMLAHADLSLCAMTEHAQAFSYENVRMRLSGYARQGLQVAVEARASFWKMS